MTKKQALIAGHYTLHPRYAPWAIPGVWPRKFWENVEYETETALQAYLASYPRLTTVTPFPSIPFGQETHEHRCAHCERTCKPQYRYCYRCAQRMRSMK